jgi:hypothetical protein
LYENNSHIENTKISGKAQVPLLSSSASSSISTKIPPSSLTTSNIATTTTATTTTTTSINIDSEGKKVNFAIKYLRHVLMGHNIYYALIPEESPTSHPVVLGEGVASRHPLESIVIHTLVWMIAKYDKGNS